MENVASRTVNTEPLEAGRNQQHPPQFSQNRQLQTPGQLRTTAEKDAQRAVCRPDEQSPKIPYDVAAEPLRIIDDEYGRPRALVPFQLLTEPNRKSHFIVVPRGYL